MAGSSWSPRRFGAAAGAGDRRRIDRRLRRAAHGRWLAHVGLAEAVAHPPGQERAAERVAGPYGVDDLGGRDLDADLLAGGERADGGRAVGDHHAGGPLAEQVRGGVGGVGGGIQVGEVFGAHLDQIGPAHETAEPVQVGWPRRDHARAAVRVQHDRDAGGQRGHQLFHAGSDRLHDQAERADMQSLGGQGQDGLAGLDRRRRRPGQVEAVAGHARRIDVHDRQRGGRVGGGLERNQDAVTVKVGSLQPAEPVLGQPAEEGRGLAEPGDGAGDVERAAPSRGSRRPSESTIRSIRASPATVIMRWPGSVTRRPGMGNY